MLKCVLRVRIYIYIYILSRLHAFRLRVIHEYLYYDSHSCFRIAHVFFKESITLDILNSYSFLCL